MSYAGLFGSGDDPKGIGGIQKIAVVSRLGDTFHARWIGVTVFNNKVFDVPVPEWKTDPFVQQTVKDDLSVATRPRVAEPLDTSGMDLATLYTKSGAITFSKEVVGVMLDQARKQGADALMVVEMATWGGISQWQTGGFGAYQRGFNGCIYTSFMITIFRTDSGKRAKDSDEPRPCLKSLDKFPVKENWEQYTPEEKATLESQVKDKIRERLIIQLQDLGLADSSGQK
ncbi:MAG: hypothetical protein JSS29_19410 [Proteobacteria bacterium]|nr:hypothetical protein [Pseudomonadota bacterium]